MILTSVAVLELRHEVDHLRYHVDEGQLRLARYVVGRLARLLGLYKETP